MDYYYSGPYGDCIQLLEDYLEIKYTADKNVQRDIVTKMLHQQPINDSEIYLVESIIFNDTLLVIKEEIAKEIKYLYILSRNSEKIQHIENLYWGNNVMC
ncbi:MAG: hypothetical protein KKH94_10095 [Candidatus Omnitrophica bacterium]|nr:hypothetical protein [Candidatus Omnitrophota bacterium]